MKAKIASLMLALLFVAVPAFTQGGRQGASRITVSGRVLDEQGAPVIGAGVMVEGTSSGTATDMNGNYTLQVPSNATLSVQSIGYRTEKVPVRGRARIDIMLSSDQELLDEIVVVGYGTQKKAT